MPPEIEISGEDELFNDTMAAFREVESKNDAPADAGRRQEPQAKTGEDRSGADAGRRGPAKDERGRFAPKAARASEKPAQAGLSEEPSAGSEDDNDAEEPQEGAEQAEKPVQTAGGPPPSWSVKAKAAWDDLPADVRADIAKREGEVAQGLSALRDYKDLKPYAEMATKHGTTLKKALDSYVGIENVLKQDIGKGMAIIAQNYGLDQARAGQLFAKLAQQFGAQVSPGVNGSNGAAPSNHGHGAPQPGDPLYNVLKPFIDPLNHQITQLSSKLTSREEADRNASQQSLAKAIDTFSSKPENRFYPDLEETITRLFETGMVPLTGNHEGDLRAAYDIAAQMVPEVREALIEQRLRGNKDAERRQEQEAADKARKASRSLTGSRVPGTVTKTEPGIKKSYDDDLAADVMAAMRLHQQH